MLIESVPGSVPGGMCVPGISKVYRAPKSCDMGAVSPFGVVFGISRGGLNRVYHPPPQKNTVACATHHAKGGTPGTPGTVLQALEYTRNAECRSVRYVPGIGVEGGTPGTPNEGYISLNRLGQKNTVAYIREKKASRARTIPLSSSTRRRA